MRRPLIAISVCVLLTGCNLFGSISTPNDGGPRSDTGADVGRDDASAPADAGGDTTSQDDQGPDVRTDDMDVPPSEGWVQLSLGSQHSCILHATGRVACWGDGDSGKLGTFSENDQLTPVLMDTELRFSMISAGDTHTCGLDRSGEIWCWGEGTHIGGPGGNDQFAPFQPAEGTWKMVDAGHDGVCAIDVDDNVKCWGDNDWLQLGVAGPAVVEDPVDPLGGLKAMDVSMGNEITCAIRLDGSAVCFGRDMAWDANDDAAPAPTTDPQEVTASVEFVAVETGRSHACALDETGRTYCWGEPALVNELTIGGGPTTAGQVSTPLAFETIESGDAFSCGLTSEAELHCWGSNYRGRQGKGDDNPGGEAEPIERAAGSAAVQRFALGAEHGCALRADGRLTCWGRNREGRLGNGMRTAQPTPVAVQTDEQFRLVSPGEYAGCGITVADDVRCWGRGRYNALGNGSNEHVAAPVDVVGLKLAYLESSGSHVCGYSPDGTGWCWGNDEYGSVGNGADGNTNVPQQIDTIETFLHVTTGRTHSCGIFTGGESACWGENDTLGIDADDGGSPLPNRVMNNHPFFETLAAGRNHTCGLDAGGAAHCFGDNAVGQLGDGTRTDSLYASVATSGGHVFSSIVAGSYFTCAIDDTGTAWCWGRGENTGDGGTSDDDVPVMVGGGHQFQQLSPAPASHVCGVTVDGEVYCWGDGAFGKLGYGGLAGRRTPQLVGLPESATWVGAGDDHSCAIGESGQPYCWGSQDFGRLGNSVDTVNSTPVLVEMSALDELQ